MQFLSPSYKQNCLRNRTEEYWIDQSGSLPENWLEEKHEFSTLWKQNQAFLSHDKKLVEKIEDFFVSPPFAHQQSIYDFLRIVDPEDAFLNLVRIKAIYDDATLINSIQLVHKSGRKNR